MKSHQFNSKFLNISAPPILTNDENSTFPFDDLLKFQNFGIQCVWSGVTGGPFSFKFQISLDGTNWNDLEYSANGDIEFSAQGSSGSHTFQFSLLKIAFLRVKITIPSTAGTLNVYLGAD